MPEARREAEVRGVGGGVDEDGDGGDGVADGAGGRREGGDVGQEELGEVCAEGDGGEGDSEGEDGLPEAVYCLCGMVECMSRAVRIQTQHLHLGTSRGQMLYHLSMIRRRLVATQRRW